MRARYVWGRLPHGPAAGRAVATLAACGWCAGLGAWAHAASADTAGGAAVGTPVLPWPVGLASLVLVAALGGLAGGLWARARHRAEMHDLRDDTQADRALADGWHWQTDAEHRLAHVRPGPEGQAAAWAGHATGRPLWQVFQGRDPQAPPLKARLDAGLPIDDLAVVPDGDAATRWLLRARPCHDGEGRFRGYRGTARLQPRDDLVDADRAALDLLMQALPGPVWLAERVPPDQEFRVRRSNAAAQRLCREAGEEPSWPTLLAALPPEVREQLDSLQAGQGVTEGAWSVHLEALPAADGAPEGRLLALLPTVAPQAVAPDTAAMAAEQESFIFTISHDLRAPIRVVEGFARILKEDYGRQLDRIGNDHLDRVLTASARMHMMIDSLLELSRLASQPLVRQPVNLSQLATYVVDDLKRHQPDRQVQVHIEPGMVAQGDPTLLRLVIENLLGNAWKYTGRTPLPEIRFECDRSRGIPAYLVADNGAGFDMRFADRLFGVFQRLHGANDFQGTGVGLASVKRIVLRHGGQVWAESEVGRGARFWFTLA